METQTSPRKRARPEWNPNPSFSQWLYAQQDEESEVGILARWVYADVIPHADGYVEPCWPHRSTTLSHLVVHLRTHHANQEGAPTELELRRAYSAYNKFALTGTGLPHRRGGIIKPERPAHRGYHLAQETVEQIKDLSAWTGSSQGEVIEKTVAVAHRALKVDAAAKVDSLH